MSQEERDQIAYAERKRIIELLEKLLDRLETDSALVANPNRGAIILHRADGVETAIDLIRGNTSLGQVKRNNRR